MQEGRAVTRGFPLTAVAVCWVAVSATATQQPTDAHPTTRIVHQGLAQGLPTDRIDSVFGEMNRTDGPGCALGVFRGGEIAYTNGYGVANLEYDIPIQPSSVFHVASIAKQFTAFAVELLVSDGLVSWDDPVQRYLPELPEYEWPITLRHLVHHTSGIRDQWSLLAMAGWRREADLITQANALAVISRQSALNFEPGSRYLYSNSGYTLLAAIVERVSGQTLRAFAAERIFGPLGMTNTHFHDDHQEIVPNRAYGYRRLDDAEWRISIPDFAIVGATSLFTTVEDMARWDKNLRDRALGDDALYERFFGRGVLNDGDTLSYAHGVTASYYRGQWALGHDGADAGYRADYVRFPDLDLGVVCLCNFAGAGPVGYTRRVARIIAADAFQRPAWERRAADQAPEVDTTRWAEAFARMQGFYRDPAQDRPIHVWVHDGNLRMAFGVGTGASGTLLVPQGGNRYQRWPDDLYVTFTMEGTTPAAIATGVGRYEFIGPPVHDVDMSPYLGSYWSEELGTEYRIEPDSSPAGLVLVHRVLDPSTYRAVFEDGFVSGRNWITFARDGGGRVVGFTLSDGRAWKVRFVKR